MKLNKIFALVVLGLGLSVASYAQDAPASWQSKTDSEVTFKPHWYLQIQGGAAHTLGETNFTDLISPAAALNFGYKFNPLIGIRFGGSAWQGKGGWALLDDPYKFKFIQGNVDATLDLGNLFAGYNHKRVFNPYLFLGVGGNYGFDNDEAVALAAQGWEFRYLWDDSKFFLAGRGGIGANFRLSDAVAFNLEVNANILSDHFNSKKAGNPDWQFNALAGFVFNLGKAYTRTISEPAPAPAPAPKEEPKPAPAPVVQPKPAPVVVEPLTENIFFDINKSVIRTSEEYKIQNLVSYLKQHGNATVSIVGYADVKTGNARINSRLSDQRSAAVKKALIDNGIAESRITTDYKGDTVQPFAINEENRVAVCIAE